MGPWSILASGWLPLPAVFGLKGHSIVFDTGSAVSADALFLELRDRGRRGVARGVPEKRRHDLRLRYFQREPSAGRSSRGGARSGRDRKAARHWRSYPRCSRAVRCSRGRLASGRYRDGLPLIGPISDVKGAYVATGHSVWGILNAPATGEAMTELILDGRASASTSPTSSPAECSLSHRAGCRLTRVSVG